MGRKKKVMETVNTASSTRVESNSMIASALGVLNPLIPAKITKVWDCAFNWNRLGDAWKPGLKVFGTDLAFSPDFDFLKMPVLKGIGVEDSIIITRPPELLKEEFYDRCVQHGLPFALLIRENDEWSDELIAAGVHKVEVRDNYFWLCVGF